MSDMAYIMETQDPRELWLVDGENKFKVSRDMYWLLASQGADLPQTYDISDLLSENAKLRSMRDTWQENDAKLRELVRDMYGFIQSMDEDCGDVTFSDCFDYCKHEATDDGCRKTGKCWYDRRMLKLGIEVSDG